MPKKKLFPIPSDYPFKLDLQSYQDGLKDISSSIVVDEITVLRRTTYTTNPNGLYAKLFQNRQLLMLSPYACAVLVYICCHLKHLDTMIHIPLKEFAMSKRPFYSALLELTHINVIRKVPHKKEMYWINVTMVVNGDARTSEENKKQVDER